MAMLLFSHQPLGVDLFCTEMSSDRRQRQSTVFWATFWSESLRLFQILEMFPYCHKQEIFKFSPRKRTN